MFVDRKSVILADSRSGFRAGLRKKFEDIGGFRIVGETTSGAAAVLLASQYPNAIVVAGSEFDDCKLQELVAGIHGHFPKTAILIVVRNAEGALALEYIEQGVSGILAEMAPRGEWRQALLSLSSGGQYVAKGFTEAGLCDLPPGTLSQLTAREAEVLRCICLGLANKQIAQQLGLSVRTVETHRFNIRRKTSAGPRLELVRLAERLGFNAQGGGQDISLARSS